MKKQIRLQLWLTVSALLLLLVSVTIGTFAWFTYRGDVNVEPIKGTVGKSDGSLLISGNPDGPFEKECEISAPVPEGGLLPVSTSDLQHFFGPGTQTMGGTIISFRNADDMVDESTLHGHVYLKSADNSTDVYLDRENLDFGFDHQALAAMRLGMRITRGSGQVYTYIFKLDDIDDLSDAQEKLTIPKAYEGMVVADETILKDGKLNMIPDPALNLSGYWAFHREDGSFDTEGRISLLRLDADEIIDVEFWLYLEGCDIHCHNERVTGVQDRETALVLSFCGQAVTH